MTAVSVEQDGEIAIVRVENPPVNAISAAVRQGLVEAAEQIAADERIEAAIIYCAGRTFMAGADVREFGTEAPGPDLPTVIRAISSSPKPWLAAIHGTALGGGLEVALACRWRVATPGARLGLPEVKLGVIPGAGGTQLLPRLVGLGPALDLITSGRQVSAAEAKSLGLVDALIEGDLRAGALAFLRAAGAPPPSLTEREVPPFDAAEVEELVEAIRRRARGLQAPVAAAEVTRAAARLSVEEGLTAERAAFLQLRDSSQAKALRHLFFAERAAGKVPGLDGVRPREVARVGVVGAGTMGSGITSAFLDAGYAVTLVETTAEALARGQARIEEAYAGLVARGRLNEPEKAARLARLSGTNEPEGLADADLVVEAVFEDMAVKTALFERLGRILRPGAVIATNTSYLDVAALAEASGRPADFLGLHFFAPANVMRLLEVVRTAHVAPDVLATGLAVGKRLGKVAVVAGDGDGFIGNRIWAFYRRQLEYLLEDGADPYQIDAAMTAYGFPMGPFAVFDLSGLDIAWAQRKRRAATRPAGERYSRIPDILCEQGRLGRKAGAGWYRYENGKALPDPAVIAVIAAERKAERTFTPEAIQARARAAMVNEAAKLLAEGVALRASDVDLVMAHGYGFPTWRGGPLFEADQIGLARVLADVEAMAEAGGEGSEPAPLLVELARRGSTFAAWTGD